MAAEYHFHGDLQTLLRRRWRDVRPVRQEVTRSASIKDVIESFGLPHTEVNRIECNAREVDFSRAVEDRDRFDIFPVHVPWDVARPTLLRPRPLQTIRFIVDNNVGRLARYLRMAGFDTLYDYRWTDGEIIALLEVENRILLTRDLDLLKRKRVEFGRYIRSGRPAAQVREVLNLFGAAGLEPFSRCLECNFPLRSVEKEDVLHRLEPLTRKYYNSFSICSRCDRIYWPGSHVDRMRRSFPEIFSASSAG
ncbi:MAG: Mut7-C RNAse domain-containing protein [Desulfobulbaceae bacterium]|jgi:uncharacterized protein with PIN domain|nr:Mut7-C RNAse domain-containing protein [Desulfobulbaceae bacterium]MDY0350523.1 Mut7-C RNAse domain-containing protein [Desulfobulbaceae bacterium]